MGFEKKYIKIEDMGFEKKVFLILKKYSIHVLMKYSFNDLFVYQITLLYYIQDHFKISWFNSYHFKRLCCG